ncbi:MAG TPA: DUF4097 family beta strand repeat-containing protein [Pyrinomonadaceae bacterium]|jgi:hypothetical protein
MKVKHSLIAFALTSSLLWGASQTSAAGRVSAKAQPGVIQQTVSVEPNVIVSLCIASGSINVRGWDRNEVQARSADAETIELRRASANGTGPATRIEVLIADPAEGPHGRGGNCTAFSDVELSVPRGAIVQLQTRDGDITVADVAEARVEAQSGNINLDHVSRLAEARALSGDITLKNSSGRIQLGSVSGSVEATNVRSITPGDDFEAGTVSGDVILKEVNHAQVHAKSVSGSLNLTGALVRGGRYDFKTMSGDVLLNVPADSSFKLNAKVAQGGEIVSDFAITPTEETTPTPPGTPNTPNGAQPPKPAPAPNPSASNEGDWTPHAPTSGRGLERLNGIFGTGDATLNLASFSGTVYLRRR